MLRIGQVEATATQDGKYTDGSVAGGIAATRLRAAAFNAMQEELAHIVESAGLTLDINDMTQVLKAIQKLTLSRTNPFADIKSDGAAAISTALTNLGLGEGAPAIGVPFFWPSAAMPNTVIDSWSSMVFLKFNGAKFSATDYPVLAKVFPA
ncbi:TPA: integrase, partial [Escherichia coli]